MAKKQTQSTPAAADVKNGKAPEVKPSSPVKDKKESATKNGSEDNKKVVDTSSSKPVSSSGVAPPPPNPELESRPVDILLFALGNAQPQFFVSRHNAGYIFADYLANCISMQHLLLQRAKEGKPTAPGDDEKIEVPEDFQRPVFVRSRELASDIHDSLFSLTDADLDPSIPAEKAVVKKSFRVVIVKPLVGVRDSGLLLPRILEKYPVKDLKSQLIVVLDDINTLAGAITVQSGTDLRSAQGHNGLPNIINSLGSNDFVRLRLGVGAPNEGDIEQYLIAPFDENTKEVDLFGHTLDLAGQALQHYIAFQDVKATKKKFGASKKIPKTLRKLPGLMFPVNVYDPILEAKRKEVEAAVAKARAEQAKK